jgi:cytochrome oxidase Cu insertion factor (SCO1/SenC/PrrC family)
MKSSTVPYWLTLMVVLATAYASWHVWRGGQRTDHAATSVPVKNEADESERITEFALEERGGRPLHSRDMQGKVWVASFFFSSCPGSCVKLNQAIEALQSGAGLGDVRFVSITCDPANDTREVLSEYANRFHADPERWFFCRGDLDYVTRIGRDVMQLAVQHQTHSDRAVVIDRAGKVRGRFLLTDSNQVVLMSRLLIQCLREPVPGQA